MVETPAVVLPLEAVEEATEEEEEGEEGEGEETGEETGMSSVEVEAVYCNPPQQTFSVENSLS
jgi:hypothetical protein